MAGRVAGKRALITGAAQGLGAATATMLARQGAKVALADINRAGVDTLAAEINAACGADTAVALTLDVTDPAAWSAAIDGAAKAMGGLSVLVNNAGIASLGSIEQTDPVVWQRTMAVNVDSVFHGCRAALPVMRECGPGSIVNISSIAGLIAGPSFAAYNTSKAAVWMLTKSIALHCAKEGYNIRCNSVHPAFVRTPMIAELGRGTTEEREARLAAQNPLGILGDPDDVAYAVLYLASDESRMMTGAELKLDGGMSAM